MLGVFLGALQYYVMYSGSLRASSSIHRSPSSRSRSRTKA